jgi:histidinol phosphatase-like PHP family hydrolase
MIDLHSHSLLSDGDLLPSELARRAAVNGVKALAITDHVDESNIEQVLAGLIKAAAVINRYWDIYVIPGVEITHVPVESFLDMVKKARHLGAGIVVGHGESPVEPVIKGTNRAAILAGVDILAHPGHITLEDASLAAERGVHLEITARKGHSLANKHVFKTALKAGAKMVLDTDSHSPCNILTKELRDRILRSLTDSKKIRESIIGNSEALVAAIKKK